MIARVNQHTKIYPIGTRFRAGSTPKPRLRRPCISRQAAFLAAYRQEANLGRAANTAKISLRQHYQWLQEDARYWQAFAEAQEEVADVLNERAFSRAVEGWLETVNYRGRPCGSIRHYDDRLLMLLLKAATPDQYH